MAAVAYLSHLGWSTHRLWQSLSYHILTTHYFFLVNSHITNWKMTMLLMGKSTISTGPFSIAFCMFTRGQCGKQKNAYFFWWYGFDFLYPQQMKRSGLSSLCPVLWYTSLLDKTIHGFARNGVRGPYCWSRLGFLTLCKERLRIPMKHWDYNEIN